jgi:hypothetical protein
MRIVLVLSLAVIGSLVGVLITALQPGTSPGRWSAWSPAVCWACGWPPPSSRAGAGRGEQQGSTGTLTEPERHPCTQPTAGRPRTRRPASRVLALKTASIHVFHMRQVRSRRSRRSGRNRSPARPRPAMSPPPYFPHSLVSPASKNTTNRDASSDRYAPTTQESSRDREDANRVFLQVKSRVVGLAGLEPAASSLSGIEGLSAVRPAFSQVAHERKGQGMRSNSPLVCVHQSWR